MGKSSRERRSRPIAVDLFCGAGGMSLGFEQAGFDVLLGIDADGYHVAVHERNFPHGKALCRSIVDLTGRDVYEALGDAAEVDLIFGGPPCQGFSNMGLRDTKDSRNTLVRQFARIVSEVRPKAFVMENVPGMLAGSTRPVLDDTIEFLSSAGYRIAQPVRVLDASKFGVPQRRKRLFLLGLRNDIHGPLSYPDAPPAGQPKRPTVWEAIGDLPDVDRRSELFERNDTAYDRKPTSDYARALRGEASDHFDYSYPRLWNSSQCTGCLRVRHTSKAIELYAATSPGEMVPGHKLPKLDPMGIAPTLRAGSDSTRGSYTAPRPVHPYKARCITAREAARLHGFPDWFSFYPLKWHAYRQIGNAVCPPVARAIGLQVMKALGRVPSKPTRAIQLTDNFALPDDRPRTLKRIPQVVHYPPVIGHLFDRAFDERCRTVVRPQFTFEDVQRAIAATGVNLSWTRADTFLPEIARSRNVRRILDACLSRGFTIRELAEDGCIGEFVPVGHPEAIDGKDFLKVSSRELGDAPQLKVANAVRIDEAGALLSLLHADALAVELWAKKGIRIEVEPSRFNGSGSPSVLYRAMNGRSRMSEGCAIAFELGSLPNRSRLSRLARITNRDELVVLVPITSKHLLAARFECCLELPKEAARGVFELPHAMAARRTKRRGLSRGQQTLF